MVSQMKSPLFVLFAGMCVLGSDVFFCRADETTSPTKLTDADGAPEVGVTSFEVSVRPFLTRYCFRCHGAEKQNAERRFDRLSPQITDDDSLVDYQDILDLLNLGEMPPKKAEQPTDGERRQVIAWFTQHIEQYHRNHRDTGGQTVLRRLNAREYRNTIRDLLHLNISVFDPTTTFPRDQTREHLDNIGATLVTSGHLLSGYLAAAEQVIDKAFVALEKPDPRKWTFRDGFHQQPEIDQVHRKTNEFRHMTLYDVVGADKHEGAYGPIHAFREGVPVDGWYTLRIKAEALHRLNPYDPEFLGRDPSEPLRLGIVAGDYRVGALHKPQPIEPLLAEIDLADESQWYTVRIWLDAGITPRFTFRNGLMDARNLWSRILRKYPDQFPELKTRGIVEARYTAIKYSKLPQIHIHEIEIEGPFYDSWPTDSQRAVLGDDAGKIPSSGALSEEKTRHHLTEFASRAFRRPAAPVEIDRLMQVIQVRRESGRSPVEAYADGLKAVLCSPEFLYLDETTDQQLTSHALASRLSYFLWSSMPDDMLLKLAETDQLQRPEILAAQVERMLADPRSSDFIDGFLGSWLTMRDLGATPPDREQFRDFYQYDLDAAMRRETHLFARHLLDQNLSIVHFLDSDFTFVNRPLARFYGLEVPQSHEFELVRISDRRRGGLLGQASVLTVTANGIDTSPVVRGVWLLENILGTPPSPPPPDVEPLDPDVRGARTIREQLQKHRDVASCRDCHQKIDPLGFALENFDAIGGWRSTYGKHRAIDSSGELPSGQSFEDVIGLKAVLIEQKPKFTRALTNKLLAYATGRQLTAADRPHVDRITDELAGRGDGFRDLVELVVLSEPFRSK